LFLLLLQSLGSLYAGFAAAQGDSAAARRLGGIAGAACGFAASLTWTLYDFFLVDAAYATVTGVARVLVLTTLGFWAGRQGANLWLSDGAGRPRQAKKPTRATAPALSQRFSLRISRGTLLWGIVGLALLSLFMAQPEVNLEGTTDGWAQFGLSALQFLGI